MRYPLYGTIKVTGEFKEKAQPGTGLPDSAGVRRHIGVDLRASKGTPVYAPGSGQVTASYGDGNSSTVVEVRIAGHLWRFMHLSKRLVSVGDSVTEGQHIADSGNSGGVAAHLHVDVRNDNTKWNDSLNNFMDFRAVIADANKPVAQAAVNWVPSGLRKDRSRVYLSSRVSTWRVYKPGTRIVAGTLLPAKNGGLSYIYRGTDVLPNRVLVNSATFGAPVSLPVDQDATWSI